MKVSFNELAIFGNSPIFSERLHVGRPNLGDRDLFIQRLNRILDERWLTNAGRFVAEFEKKLTALLNVKHCIPICNGTVALEIVIKALQLTGEVIIPSLTFIATAHALQWQEISPVFCDIDPDTHNIDPDKIHSLITPRTSAIIGVHLWGRPAAIDSLQEIASHYNLKLIFDAAHALGCSYQGRMIGNFGNAEVFSFHATKFVNSFEGGAIATNDDLLANRIRLMKNFGFAGYDNVIYIGTNGKMSEPSAAMGLTSLESIDVFIATNRANYFAYAEELKNLRGLKLLSYNESEFSNYQYIVCEIDEKEAGISRDNIIEILHQENVIARRYFYPGCHKMEPYRSYQPNARLLLRHTEDIANKLLILPTGSTISREDIHKICQILRLVLQNGSIISERISQQQSH